MKHPFYSPQAKTDLREIATYLASRDTAAARRVIGDLRERCRLLARQPGLGPLQPDLGPEVRVAVVWPYVVYFRTVPGGIRVERVLHGARDIDAILRGLTDEEE